MMRVFVCVLLVLAAVPGSAEAGLRIDTLSTRPDMVTGGDVLVRVPPHSVVRLNGHVVTLPGRTGLVTGLTLGANRLTATTQDGTARLTLRNHPITGPVFSGPHEQPFVCETEAAGLGAPLDGDCSIATRVREVSGPGYVASVETGTINRGIYEIAVPRNWNRRLIYNFGGGCTDGWYRQGPGTAGVLDAFMLSHGYAVASSSLNVFGNNCQEVTAAETMMMVKEHFIETYGPVAHTQGFGCSGGSYQQHQIADNYPGLLDGIIPGCSFPEVTQATVSFITDAWLLDHYFGARRHRLDRGAAARRHRLRHSTRPRPTWRPARAGSTRAGSAASCPRRSATTRVTNPGGVRCDLYDHAINVWGRDPATGFARRPLDNVGIQYGLKALNTGAITTAQFLDLNEQVGGFDADANIVPAPHRRRPESRRGGPTAAAASPTAASASPRSRSSTTAPTTTTRRTATSTSATTRSRCASACARRTATPSNQVMLVEDQRYGLYSTDSPLLQHAILALDRWITTGRKPADLREGCMTRDAQPTFIAETQRRDPSTRCERLYPSASFPREVAGAGVAADIVKCRLKPIDRGDYRVRSHGGRRRAAARDLPRRRLRLEPPGRRAAAARRDVAHLRTAVVARRTSRCGSTTSPSAPSRITRAAITPSSCSGRLTDVRSTSRAGRVSSIPATEMRPGHVDPGAA